MQILKEIAKEKKIFNSLKEIRDEIKKRAPEYKIPNVKRIIRLMIKLGAKLKTKTKKIKEELKFCPICEVPFKSLKEKNLFGKEIIMFYFCPICKFKTKDKKEVPIRYKIVFD